MDDLTRRLREADPVPHERGPSDDAYREMRRRIVATDQAAPIAAFGLQRSLPIAVALGILVALGAMSTRRGAAVRVGEEAALPAPSSFAAADRTQVQFSTPGGTTIVWTIDPAFDLKEARR